MTIKNFLSASGLTALLLLGLPLHATEPPQSAFALDIQSQPLRDALSEFGRQSGLQVVFIYTDIDQSIVSSQLSGTYSAQDALQRLLANTALNYEFINQRTVAIRAAAAATGSRTKTGWEDNAIHLVRTEESQNAVAPAAQSAGSDEIRIQEIVVTATKRGEASVQDVPMSISVISNQDIERRGLIGMEDYLRSIPGVNQIDRGALDNSIIIRGITTGVGGLGDNYANGAAVSTYFGETSITGAAGAYGGGIDIRPVDLERIEVLRGPQGTAFGDASLGGTMRLIPATPKLDQLNAKFSGYYSNTESSGSDNSMVQAVINIPVVQDVFALRAVGYRYEDSGFYQNVVGTDPASIALADSWNIGNEVRGYAQKEVGSMRSTGGRLAARWRVTDKLDLSANLLTQKIEQDGQPFSTGSLQYKQLIYPIAAPARVRGEQGEAIDTEIDLANLTLNHDFGWAAATATVSAVDSGTVYVYDQSRLFGQPLSNTNRPDFKSTSAEVRVASKLAGRLQYLAGVYYQEFESNAFQSGYSPGPPAPNRYGGNPAWIFTLDRKVDQRAVFGEVSYDLTDKLIATVGGRYTKYGRDEQQFREGGLYGTAIGAPLIATLSSTNNRPSLKANLSYKPTREALLYASWSQGFRLGRPQSGLTPFRALCDYDGDGVVDGTNVSIDSTTEVESDYLDNYEVGGKFALFDQRLVFDTTIYHIQWNKLPVGVGVDCPGIPFRGYLDNVGKSNSDGIEFQASLLIAQGLRLDFGGGYNRAEIARDELLQGWHKGDRLPGSPKVNANLALQYDFEVAGRKAFVRTDSFYTGAFYPDLQETADWEAGDYVKVDARTGVLLNDFSVELFVRNLTNEDAFTFRSYDATGGALPSYQLRPRTIGLQIGYTF